MPVNHLSRAAALLSVAGLMAQEPPAPAPPRATRVANVVVDCAAKTPTMRLSPDGRWLVLAHERHDAAAAWSYRRVTLVDLARGEVRLDDRAAFPGRAAPVFDRGGTQLAWTNGLDPAHVVATRMKLGDQHESSWHAIPLGAAAPFVSACAIDGDRLVVHDPGPARGAERLVVHDLARRQVCCEVAAFDEPGHGRTGCDVVLAWPHLLSHTRSADGPSGGGHRLVLTDARDGRARADFGAHASHATPRFVVSRDGRTMWNGTSTFAIEQVDLERAQANGILAARQELYSHFLELTVSPDENLIVAWSRESRVLVVWNRRAQRRLDVPLGRVARVLGIDARGERVWLETRQHGMTALALPGPADEVPVIEGEYAFVVVASNGVVAVTGRAVAEGLELQVWRLPD